MRTSRGREDSALLEISRYVTSANVQLFFASDSYLASQLTLTFDADVVSEL